MPRSIEVFIEYEFRDAIAEQLDAGVRISKKLEQDMISLSVSPELRLAVAASHEYLAEHSAPHVPNDLEQHCCIGYRMRAHGALVPWWFLKNGREMEVKVEESLLFNEPELALDAAVDGLGLAYVIEDRAKPFLT